MELIGFKVEDWAGKPQKLKTGTEVLIADEPLSGDSNGN
jgi:hypothetical protein